MIARSTLLLLLAFQLSVSALQAQDPIIGAFGVELGAAFDRKAVVSQETDKIHYDYYLIDPPAASYEFQHYAIYVTPFTNLVYTLTASGRYFTPGRCLKMAQSHVSELARKHGPPVENDISESGPARFAVGPRTIVVQCETSPGFTYLRITYTDAQLAQEARGS